MNTCARPATGVHEQFPAASAIQPVYVEPVTIGMKSQLITVGDPVPEWEHA